MKNELITDYEMALRGREYWLELEEKYLLEYEDALIIFPSDDCELNKSAMKWLPEFLEKKYVKRALVVVKENEIAKWLNVEEYDIKIDISNEEKIFELLKYYRLVQFTKNIAVISMELPYGNNHFIGKKNITIDDYVRNAIYV